MTGWTFFTCALRRDASVDGTYLGRYASVETRVDPLKRNMDGFALCAGYRARSNCTLIG